MAIIKPFPGIRYNPAQVADIARVLCPPYDIISEAERDTLYARDPHNYVRLEHARDMPGDDDTENKFNRSARTLEEWLAAGVMVHEASPAVYVHDHLFRLNGQEYRRRGLIARVRLEEWESMVVRPHEDTFPGPKNERLRLMAAAEANISPIMALYEDADRQITDLLAGATTTEPTLATDWYENEKHHLWAVSDPAAQAAITETFTARPIYIADGHHRYESALTYRREQAARQPDAPEDAPFNYVMVTLLDFEDAGLLALPPHRLARGLDADRLAQLPAGLEAFFEIESWPSADPQIWPRVDDFLAAGGPGGDRLVASGVVPDQLLALKVRDYAAIDRLMPPQRSEAYCRLGVSIIDHVILEHLLGITRADQEGRLAYNTDRDAVIRAVADGSYQLALLLGTMRTSVIKDIADASDRMPRKATYFHPKLPSGLVCHRLK